MSGRLLPGVGGSGWYLLSVGRAAERYTSLVLSHIPLCGEINCTAQPAVLHGEQPGHWRPDGAAAAAQPDIALYVETVFTERRLLNSDEFSIFRKRFQPARRWRVS